MTFVLAPTYDEPGHLAGGISHWQHGNFDTYQVNPPVIRLVAAAPLLLMSPETDWREYLPGKSRSEFGTGDAFMVANGSRAFWYVTIARWACLPFSLLGMWACYVVGRDLFGKPAGVVAAALWAFSPNVLANAALITPDVAAAALGLVAAYTFWKWLREPGWMRAIIAGFALGFCLSSKFTWIILVPILPLLGFFGG